MAKPTQKSVELGELIRRSETARLKLGQAHAKLKRKLDVPARVKDSLQSNPIQWVGGSLASGFLGSFLFKSRRSKAKKSAKRVKKERGFWLATLMLLLTLAKPAAKIYATNLLKDYLSRQLRSKMSKKFGKRNISPNTSAY